MSYIYNSKLNEVGLIDNEHSIYEGADNGRTKVKTTSNGAGKAAVLQISLLVLLIVLVLMLMGMTAYSMSQSMDNKCSYTAVGGDDTDLTNAISHIVAGQVATCNVTNMQQTIQTLNSTISHLVLNLLQESTKTMDMDFQCNNATETMNKLLKNTENYLMHIINTLSNHKDTSISTSSVVDDILIGVNELLAIHNTSSLYNSITPVSCKDIKEKLPNSPSGFYHVNNRDIYCNMNELCGSGGGWTRLAYLDMTDSTVNCPDELPQYFMNNIRMCLRQNSNSAGCSPLVKFPSNGITYSEICGRVIGYQWRTPDAVAASHGSPSAQNNINSYYVDGVSLTRGSPRQHVWTFMAGPHGDHYTEYNCPCNDPPGSLQQIPSFVGSHYFCESGYSGSASPQSFYASDPLWDGQECNGQESGCCSGNFSLPWFHRQYNDTITDYLELRICADEAWSNEAIPISFYEIFVK